jgi:hypothetical protein
MSRGRRTYLLALVEAWCWRTSNAWCDVDEQHDPWSVR